MRKSARPRSPDPVVLDRERGAFAGDVAQRVTDQLKVMLQKVRAPQPVTDPDAYSIAEFCQRHRISVEMFYKLQNQRRAPQTFTIGTRVLISKEAAARWRVEREAATAANAAAHASA